MFVICFPLIILHIGVLWLTFRDDVSYDSGLGSLQEGCCPRLTFWSAGRTPGKGHEFSYESSALEIARPNLRESILTFWVTAVPFLAMCLNAYFDGVTKVRAKR